MAKLWLFSKHTRIIPFIEDKFAGKDISISYKDTDHWEFSDRFFEDIIAVAPGPEIRLRPKENKEDVTYVIRILYDGEEIGVLSESATFSMSDKNEERMSCDKALEALTNELYHAVYKLISSK